jgi:hypothetical protein
MLSFGWVLITEYQIRKILELLFKPRFNIQGFTYGPLNNKANLFNTLQVVKIAEAEYRGFDA